MAATVHHPTYHLILSTRRQSPWLTEEVQPRLWDYLASLARQRQMTPLSIGGHTDHVHALLQVPPHLALSEAVPFLKVPASAWLHETFPWLRSFAWQDGFGSFQVSEAQTPEMLTCIRNQRAQHRVSTFQEELIGLFSRYGIAWKPEHVWG